MYTLSEDLSTITTIPKNSIDKLMVKMEWCVCQNVEEQINKHELITEINIGIGVLCILVEDNCVKYKFIPSKSLETNLHKTITTMHNPIELALEEGLVNRILHAYKDIL